MKKRMLWLFTALMFSSASAQMDIYQPIGFDVQPLANQLLPDQTLSLFHPDTLNQILFHPARAHFYTKSFVTVNYIPNRSRYYSPSYPYYYNAVSNNISVPEPTLSFNALFKKKNASWLIQFENSVQQRQDEEAEQRVDLAPDATYEQYVHSSHEVTHQEINTAATRFRISRIGGTRYGAWGLGLWGQYHQLNKSGSTEYETFEARSETWTDPTQYSSTARHSLTQYTFDNAKSVLGLDLSLTGEDWDFRQTVGYLNSNNNCNVEEHTSVMRFASTHYSDYYDTGIDTLFSLQRTYQQQFDSRLIQNPDIVFTELYLSKKCHAVTETDRFFLSLQFAKAMNNELDYEFCHEKFEARVDQRGESYSRGDTLAIYGDGIEEGHFTRSRLKAGFITTQSWPKLKILAGVVGSFHHLKSLNMSAKLDRSGMYYNGDIKTLLKIESILSEYKIQIPLFIDFAPAKQFHVYGGFYYNYIYFDSQIDYSSTTARDGETNFEVPANRRNEEQNKRFFSESAFRMGMRFDPYENLTVHVAFNETLSSLSYWNLSLGYFF